MHLLFSRNSPPEKHHFHNRTATIDAKTTTYIIPFMPFGGKYSVICPVPLIFVQEIMSYSVLFVFDYRIEIDILNTAENV